MGNPVWLVAQPPNPAEQPVTGSSVDVDVFQVSGPMWGDDFDPADRVLATWGTGTFSFESCSSGSFSLTPGEEAQGLGYTDLSYALTRDLLTSGIPCPTAD